MIQCISDQLDLLAVDNLRIHTDQYGTTLPVAQATVLLSRAPDHAGKRNESHGSGEGIHQETALNLFAPAMNTEFECQFGE